MAQWPNGIPLASTRQHQCSLQRPLLFHAFNQGAYCVLGREHCLDWERGRRMVCGSTTSLGEARAPHTPSANMFDCRNGERAEAAVSDVFGFKPPPLPHKTYWPHVSSTQFGLLRDAPGFPPRRPLDHLDRNSDPFMWSFHPHTHTHSLYDTHTRTHTHTRTNTTREIHRCPQENTW